MGCEVSGVRGSFVVEKVLWLGRGFEVCRLLFRRSFIVEKVLWLERVCFYMLMKQMYRAGMNEQSAEEFYAYYCRKLP